jgi:ATP-binding cassette, subfamily B (MDR/TAP), member 1
LNLFDDIVIIIIAMKYIRHEDVKEEDEKDKAATENNATVLKPSNVISSAFTNIRTIHALSMQEWVLGTYDQMMKERSRDRSNRGVVAGLGYGGSNCVLFGTFALLFWYGSTLMEDGEITYEELLIAIMALMFGTFGIGQALNDMGDQKQAIFAAKRIFKLIDGSNNSTLNPTDPLSEDGEIPSTARIGNIEVKNVHFRYPTRKEVKVCENFSLQIQEGEVVALVGASGCGKVILIKHIVFTNA